MRRGGEEEEEEEEEAEAEAEAEGGGKKGSSKASAGGKGAKASKRASSGASAAAELPPSSAAISPAAYIKLTVCAITGLPKDPPQPAPPSAAAGEAAAASSSSAPTPAAAAAAAARELSLACIAAGVPPYVPTEEVTGVGTGFAGVDVTKLARLPLAVQVEEALRRARVLPFGRLLEVCQSAGSVARALEVCSELGRLVRGNWVLRSEVYFGRPWHVRAGGKGSGGAGSSSSASASSSSSSAAAAAASSALTTAAPLSSLAPDIHCSWALGPAAMALLVAARDTVLLAFHTAPEGIVELEDLVRAAPPGLARAHILSIAQSCSERVGEWEQLHGGEGPGSIAEEAEAALLGPTLDNGNVHMAGRGARGGGGHRLQFKWPVDEHFAERFPAEAEKARKWWRKRAAELQAE